MKEKKEIKDEHPYVFMDRIFRSSIVNTIDDIKEEKKIVIPCYEWKPSPMCEKEYQN